MAGLTPEQINSLLGSARVKGEYVTHLNQFVTSGEAGIGVFDTWASYSERKPQTVKQGFENAKNSKNAHADAKYVQVLLNDEKVFLINRKAAGLATDEMPAAEAEVAA